MYLHPDLAAGAAAGGVHRLRLKAGAAQVLEDVPGAHRGALIDRAHHVAEFMPQAQPPDDAASQRVAQRCAVALPVVEQHQPLSTGWCGSGHFVQQFETASALLLSVELLAIPEVVCQPRDNSSGGRLAAFEYPGARYQRVRVRPPQVRIEDAFRHQRKRAGRGAHHQCQPSRVHYAQAEHGCIGVYATLGHSSAGAQSQLGCGCCGQLSGMFAHRQYCVRPLVTQFRKAQHIQ